MEEKKDKKKQNVSSMKYAWIIGALVLIVAGWFGVKAMLSSLGEYKVSLVSAPKEVEEGNIATFTWRIDGPPTTINQTVVYYGMESNQGELDKNVKPSDTNYTDFVKDFVSGDYGVPLQFIGNTKVDKQGKYYFRIYAPVKGKNYWSDEYTFDVVPASHKISIVPVSDEVSASDNLAFTWRITGPKTTVNSTSVYYGPESNPGELGADVEPGDTNYTNNTKDFVKGEYTIPLQFVANVSIASPGSYFYRAHTVIEGENYWTDEGAFEVK